MRPHGDIKLASDAGKSPVIYSFYPTMSHFLHIDSSWCPRWIMYFWLLFWQRGGADEIPQPPGLILNTSHVTSDDYTMMCSLRHSSVSLELVCRRSQMHNLRRMIRLAAVNQRVSRLLAPPTHPGTLVVGAAVAVLPMLCRNQPHDSDSWGSDTQSTNL